MIAEPLSIIYQRCLLTGEVAEDWRLANVTPIYKKGCRDDPGNYRPVSQTLVLGKIMEQIEPPIVREETVRDLLLQLDCHKSMGLHEIHPRVLRER